jgi:hypothetical protein
VILFEFQYIPPRTNAAEEKDGERLDKTDAKKTNQNILTELKIHLAPRSSRNQLVSCTDDQLKIKITAPPVEGRANQALIAFLAKQLGIAKSRVELAGGETSKQKKIKIHGLALHEIHDRLKR